MNLSIHIKQNNNLSRCSFFDIVQIYCMFDIITTSQLYVPTVSIENINLFTRKIHLCKYLRKY